MTETREHTTSPLDTAKDIAREVLKTEQEQHKTYQKGMDLLMQVGNFLGGVFRPAATELGQLLGDQMRYWRFKNAVNIMTKAEEIAKERKLSSDQMKALSFGAGVRLLEAASQEDDESVQEMWARLIANSVDPNTEVSPEKMYIDVLKSFSGREVRFLDLLSQYETLRRRRFQAEGERLEAESNLQNLAETGWRKFDPTERNASIQNLIRLRCVAPNQSRFNTSFLFRSLSARSVRADLVSGVDRHEMERVLDEILKQQRVASGITDYPLHEKSSFNGFPEAAFALTSLGRSLMKACRANTPSNES